MNRHDAIIKLIKKSCKKLCKSKKKAKKHMISLGIHDEKGNLTPEFGG